MRNDDDETFRITVATTEPASYHISKFKQHPKLTEDDDDDDGDDDDDEDEEEEEEEEEEEKDLDEENDDDEKIGCRKFNLNVVSTLFICLTSRPNFNLKRRSVKGWIPARWIFLLKICSLCRRGGGRAMLSLYFSYIHVPVGSKTRDADFSWPPGLASSLEVCEFAFYFVVHANTFYKNWTYVTFMQLSPPTFAVRNW